MNLFNLNRFPKIQIQKIPPKIEPRKNVNNLPQKAAINPR